MVEKATPVINRIISIAVIAVVITLTLVAYMTTVSALPLADEYYLLNFVKGQSVSMMGFLTAMVDWPGPQMEDTWGILSSSLLGLAAILAPNKSLAAIRAIQIVVHIVNAWLVYLVTRDGLEQPDNAVPSKVPWVAAGAACIFAIYPLAPEAVSWLGGMAYEIACTFFLIAFFLYLKGKRERNWTTLGLSWISFLLAIVSDNSLWSSGFVIVALELAKSFIGTKPGDSSKVPSAQEVFEDAVEKMMVDEAKGMKARQEQRAPAAEASDKPDTEDSTTSVETSEGRTASKAHSRESKEDGPDVLFDTLVPALPFIVLGVLISIRALPASSNQQLPSDVIAGIGDWGRVLKHLFFPINEPLTPHYAKHYAYLYILYGAPGIVALLALIRNRKFRQNVAFLCAWLLVMLVPHLHQALSDSALTWSRFAYNAIVPASALLSVLFCSSLYALSNKYAEDKTNLPLLGHLKWADSTLVRTIATAVSILLVILLLPGNLSRTSAQNCAYKRGAKWFDTICASARNITRKEKAPYALVRDVPPSVALVPKISPFSVIILDGENNLIRAYKVPGGPLKQALKEGRYRETTVHWSADHNSLIKVDLGLGTPPLTRETADGIRHRLRPGIEFLKTVQYDQANHTLILDSNAETGPVITFDAFGMSPIGDDFVYVDAKINTPQDDPGAHMEMYWLTVWQKDYENKDRLAKSKVVVNDNQFHRYYLPVRSTAWSTEGPITHITLGFPASAKVVFKEIGTETPSNRLPILTYSTTTKTNGNKDDENKILLAQLAVDYPMLPELGLVRIDRNNDELAFHFDATMIENANSCMLEISQPDRFFENPNADELSKKATWKSVDMEKTSGITKLTGKDFKNDGVYSIRLFARDKEGKLLANSSDEINCLVYTDK